MIFYFLCFRKDLCKNVWEIDFIVPISKVSTLVTIYLHAEQLNIKINVSNHPDWKAESRVIMLVAVSFAIFT